MAEDLNLTDSLSRYIVSDQAAQLPQPIVERARIHILDTIGAMISGSTLRPGKSPLISSAVRVDLGMPQSSRRICAAVPYSLHWPMP